MGASTPYCTGSMVPPTILTPISVADSSVRPSPALSHHSQEYCPQEYHYNINDSVQPQGLGISAPFPSEFPRTTAPNANYYYAHENLQRGLCQTPNMSPQGPSPKRMKRTASRTPSRDTPVNILPNPEGVERMERERQSGHATPLRPRAPGRGRRDPQAEAEDRFVEELRNQNYPWKIVRDMFQAHFGKDASEARLQMRLLRRRKERMTRWDDDDVSMLPGHAVGDRLSCTDVLFLADSAPHQRPRNVGE